jgi:hypothetical protein
VAAASSRVNDARGAARDACAAWATRPSQRALRRSSPSADSNFGGVARDVTSSAPECSGASDGPEEYVWH